MRQLCTELAQQASTETDVVGQWLHRMNYAYHEVKGFLATEIFDTARHYTVFRRRALANGGSLGLESPGQINRRLLESRAGWTETALYLYILRGTLTLLIYRYGEAYARNWTDKLLFRHCMEDKARHMAYGMAHLKYAVEQRGPDYGLGLQRLMGGVERDLASEMGDPVPIVEGIGHAKSGLSDIKIFGVDLLAIDFGFRFQNKTMLVAETERGAIVHGEAHSKAHLDNVPRVNFANPISTDRLVNIPFDMPKITTVCIEYRRVGGIEHSQVAFHCPEPRACRQLLFNAV